MKTQYIVHTFRLTGLILLLNLACFSLMAQPADHIGYWPFDDNAQNMGADTNHGTVMNEATLVPEGYIGGAYTFDGHNDYIELNTPYTFDSTQAWTIGMWINWTGASTDYWTTDLFGENNYGNSFLLKKDNNKYFAFRNSAKTYHYFSQGSSDSLYQTGWRHVVVRANGQGNLSVYLDGQHVETMVANTSFVFHTIGRSYPELRYGFNGSIDEVYLYNRSLSSEEINQLYTASTSEPRITDHVSHWELNGNGDDKTNTNPGTVSGAIPTRDRYNQANGAMSFDGVDDYIKFTHEHNFDSTDAWTVSMWLDWKGYSANKSLTLLFGKESTGDGFAIRAGGNNNFMHRNINGTFNYFQLESSSELYNNGWKHLTVSADGTGNISAYIDGNHIQTITANTSISVNAFGRAYPTNDYCYNGSLDDIRIYNRALSSEEVTLLYNSEKTTSMVPVAYSKNTITPGQVAAPAITENFVHTITLRDTSKTLTAGNYSAVEQVQYFDGLGRPSQVVSIQASPTGADIVQPVEYDEFGREAKKYLPYTKAGNNGQFINPNVALTEQANFYNPVQNPDVNYATDAAPWAETIFENSPLNRVLEQGAPGEPWQVEKDINGVTTKQGKTVKTYYATNTASSVKLWKAGSSLTNIYQSGHYNAGELIVTEVQSENFNPDSLGHVTLEYKNKQGQVVLKETENNNGNWLQTYYVYNNKGLLRCVIPPKAAARTTGIIDQELCYFYTYDHRKRMTHKKLPGAATVYMVYDRYDRLVATQDGNMRYNTDGSEKNQWIITRYDSRNRPVITARYTADSLALLGRLAADQHNRYETLTGGTETNMHGYTSQSFPADLIADSVLTVIYYDNYTAVQDYARYDALMPLGNKLDNAIYSFVPQIDTNTKAQVTATKTKVLGTVNQYHVTVTYYDKKGRPVQIVADNYLGATDRISTHYNFVGEVLATITEHTNGTDTIVMGDRFSYDHTGRVQENWQQIAGNEEILLAANKYNELGELVEKYTHGTKETDGSINTIQKTDYAYNIRGWMTSINDTENLKPATENDLFAMNLHYNDASSLTGLSVNGQYNGNISAINWVDAHTNQQKAYTFVYDGINRLKAANYETNAADVWSNSLAFDVPKISYDLNGNIDTLRRYNDAGDYLDNLIYTYYNNGNRLQTVSDASGNTLGFNDGNTTDTDYTYDANGNMVTDLNKGITSNISYNYLNLPQSITHKLGTTEYVYNADGVKLSHDDGTTITKYIGNFVYENGSLRYILTGEGKIEHNAGTFAYQYFHKDHLGNTRVTYKQNGEIVQTADYYPFGLRHEPMALEDASQKYLYNGKELQPELGWLDYGARFYEPSLAKFMTIDPLAEKYSSHSSYHYALNNPIRFSDFMGMGAEEEGKEEEDKKEKPSTKPALAGAPLLAAATKQPHLKVVHNVAAKGSKNPLTFLIAANIVVWSTNIAIASSMIKDYNATKENLAQMEAEIKEKESALILPENYTNHSESNEEYDDDEMMTVYRGVSADINPKAQYNFAQAGLSVPKGLIPDLSGVTPHSNPTDHSDGDNYSLMTSWTTDEGMASAWAKGPMGTAQGVILTKVIRKEDAIISNSMNASPEAEIQLLGVQKADKVEHVTP